MQGGDREAERIVEGEGSSGERKSESAQTSVQLKREGSGHFKKDCSGRILLREKRFQKERIQREEFSEGVE